MTKVSHQLAEVWQYSMWVTEKVQF